MNVNYLPLHGACVFNFDQHRDHRGWFTETYRETWMNHYIPQVKFIFEFVSKSDKPGTIRGLHAQNSNCPQAKLVTVLNGKIQDILVDARVGSNTYGKYCSVILDAERLSSVFIPEGFYHGFISLEPNTIVHYKTNNYHSAKDEIGVAYNDPFLNIDWQIIPPITVSQRDQFHPIWEQAYKFTGYYK